MDRIIEESKQSVTCPICTDVFDDPRLLTCSHSFCLHCLLTFRGPELSVENKFCPVCRALTVPPANQLPALPPNDFAAKVAKLIRENEPTPQAAAAGDGGALAEDGFFRGDFIEDPADESGQVGMNFKIGASIAVGAVVSVATGGFLGVLTGLALAGFGTASTIEAEKKKRQRYECSGCGHVRFSALRYMCGMCTDCILCSTCFERTGNLSPLHNSQHLFVKLKFQQKRRLPPGPVLKAKATELVQTMNYDSDKHGRTYVHSPEKLIIVPAIRCKSCGVQPITGIRYKCGMCRDYDLCADCERNSERKHDKDHVFIVMKNPADVNIIGEPLLSALFY